MAGPQWPTVRPQRPQRGRNSRASTVRDGRQYAIAVEGTVITFECKRHRHTYKIDFSKKPLANRLSPSACKMMADWWGKKKGGCIGTCPKCERMKRTSVEIHRGCGGAVTLQTDVWRCVGCRKRPVPVEEVEVLQVKIGKRWNPRYVAYAQAHNRTPEEQTTHDEMARPSGPLLGFIDWIGRQWREWCEIHKRPHDSRLPATDHADFDLWLLERAAAQIASTSKETI